MLCADAVDYSSGLKCYVFFSSNAIAESSFWDDQARCCHSSTGLSAQAWWLLFMIHSNFSNAHLLPESMQSPSIFKFRAACLCCGYERLLNVQSWDLELMWDALYYYRCPKSHKNVALFCQSVLLAAQTNSLWLSG